MGGIGQMPILLMTTVAWSLIGAWLCAIAGKRVFRYRRGVCERCGFVTRDRYGRCCECGYRAQPLGRLVRDSVALGAVVIGASLVLIGGWLVVLRPRSLPTALIIRLASDAAWVFSEDRKGEVDEICLAAASMASTEEEWRSCLHASPTIQSVIYDVRTAGQSSVVLEKAMADLQAVFAGREYMIWIGDPSTAARNRSDWVYCVGPSLGRYCFSPVWVRTANQISIRVEDVPPRYSVELLLHNWH